MSSFKSNENSDPVMTRQRKPEERQVCLLFGCKELKNYSTANSYFEYNTFALCPFDL